MGSPLSPVMTKINMEYLYEMALGTAPLKHTRHTNGCKFYEASIQFTIEEKKNLLKFLSIPVSLLA